DGVIHAVDAGSGAVRWNFPANAPIRMPPTIAGGRLYAGAGDGFVYCLEAATGRPLWRFRAAPAERQIMVYGRL
ncbi:MAG TPA: pyrrolo-quinoline quinone, partial [Planctomycetaceae bacterium]|nr:pyrrolo-quinoline quinone [Planctomycetaceae bacterium]